MKTDKITEKLKKTGGKIAAFGRTFRISFLLLFLALLTTAAAVFLSWRRKVISLPTMWAAGITRSEITKWRRPISAMP